MESDAICESQETSNRVNAGISVFDWNEGKIHGNIFLFILALIFFSSSGSFKGNVRKHETIQNKMTKNSGQTFAN